MYKEQSCKQKTVHERCPVGPVTSDTYYDSQNFTRKATIITVALSKSILKKAANIWLNLMWIANGLPLLTFILSGY